MTGTPFSLKRSRLALAMCTLIGTIVGTVNAQSQTNTQADIIRLEQQIKQLERTSQAIQQDIANAKALSPVLAIAGSNSGTKNTVLNWSKQPVENNNATKRMQSLLTDPELKRQIASAYALNGKPAPLNSKLNCWIVGVRDRTFCVKLVDIQPFNIGGQEVFYARTAGIAVDKTLQPESFRAASGLIGLFKLVKVDKSYRTIAQESSIEIGSSGEPPEQVKLFVIGPHARRAWAIQSGYAHMGYAGESITIYTSFADHINFLGTLSIYADNEGACSADMAKRKECIQKTFNATLTTDAQSSAGFVYPLTADIEVRNEKGFTKQRVVVPFDLSTDQYLPPLLMLNN